MSTIRHFSEAMCIPNGMYKISVLEAEGLVGLHGVPYIKLLTLIVNGDHIESIGRRLYVFVPWRPYPGQDLALKFGKLGLPDPQLWKYPHVFKGVIGHVYTAKVRVFPAIKGGYANDARLVELVRK